MSSHLKTANFALEDKNSFSYHNSNSISKSSFDIQSFCQLQTKQFLFHETILFAQIVYYDPVIKVHKSTASAAQTYSTLSQKQLDYLSSEEWLTDYPSNFSINEVKLQGFASYCYLCLLGHRDQKPEYIIIFAQKPLSLNLQCYIKQSAVFISKYLDIYSQSECQKAEIKLLEQIVQRVGHQLRNPLALISLYAENLCLRLLSGSLREQAIIIRETAQDLERNLTDLIYCGQKTKLKVSLQDIRILMSESLQELQPWINEKQLKISYPENSATLPIDRLQIKQVFGNLLKNAIQLSPNLGTITCNWQVFQDEVLIYIADQGPGLSQEDLQKIFTPFYSRRSGGTGLGLTIARKIVLDHQGSLWGQNLLAGGAQFYISLPRSLNC